MMKKGTKALIGIIIASLFMAVVDLPDNIKAQFPTDPVSNWLREQKVTLGLDLQGGTQLDYRIDLRNAVKKNEDEDPNNDVNIYDVIEGVRTTIERRVNNLGVSEPQIYTSSIAGEEHIIVELAGIKDVEEAKAVVGKTIQLEFKEPKTEADPDEIEAIKSEAQSTLDKINNENFVAIAESTKTSDGKIDFRAEKTRWGSELPTHLTDLLPNLQPGNVHSEVIEGSDGFSVGTSGNISEKKGLYLVQLVNKETKDRTQHKQDDFFEVAKQFSTTDIIDLNDRVKGDFDPEEVEIVWGTAEGEITEFINVGEETRVYKIVEKNEEVAGGPSEVKASHILIAYAGAERADPTVLRDKQEAQKEAIKIAKQAQENPDNFAELAKEHSDGPSGPNGGDLGFFGPGMMATAFEETAFSMQPGEVSEVVETDFGFHIIKVTEVKAAKESTISVHRIKIANTQEAKAELEAALKKVTEGYDVTEKETEFVWNELFFDTTPDPWKSTGLDGAHFRYASVSYDHVGYPQVNIEFDSEGGLLFEELTGRLVNQRMAIFVGGELISAPSVNQKITGGSAVITGNFSLQEALDLANDLNTGAIDAPIILSGQYTISATLGENALATSLYAGLVGLIALGIFMILYYRLLGIFAVIALGIYSIMIIFILKTTPIVMTLAGIAGIILSIGMAVDANILIFERTKEELNEGKGFARAVIIGFERAWSSIRDSNVSSLITCVILYFFGNSIIRGFALMLAIGILLSMFTAITVTRAFLQTMEGSSLTKKRWLLGVKKVD